MDYVPCKVIIILLTIFPVKGRGTVLILAYFSRMFFWNNISLRLDYAVV